MNVKTTDHVDCVRYAKVSPSFFSLSQLKCEELYFRTIIYIIQNIWNCAWSSIEGLSRAFPSTFDELPKEVTQPLKDFMKEIVDVGFKAGLLKQGDIQLNTGEPITTAEDMAAFCWQRVSFGLTAVSIKVSAAQESYYHDG